MTVPAVGRVLGELDIDVLVDGHAPGRDARPMNELFAFGRRAEARPF
jgi:hypothetical protein